MVVVMLEASSVTTARVPVIAILRVAQAKMNTVSDYSILGERTPMICGVHFVSDARRVGELDAPDQGS
mgnify:CR=1 FL=1